MAETIFGNPEEQKPASPAQETPDDATSVQQDVKETAESKTSQDSYASLLATIQSEDGRQKYATVEDALKSVSHAQDYIKELKDKMTELERRVNETESVDEIVKRLESKQANREEPSKQELDETKLAEILESKLTQREKEAQRRTNQQEVVRSLADAYGDKAEEMYVKKAQELGIGLDTLNSLSSMSPKAVLEYFGLSKVKASSSGLGKSSVNTAAMDLRPRQEEDHMAKFQSSDSELLARWRKAASKFEG